MVVNGMTPENPQRMPTPQQPRRPPPQTSPAAPSPVEPASADDITSQVADTARMIREIGAYAEQHGAYLRKLSEEYADRLQITARDYATDLLNSERRKLAELEKIMGRTGTGPRSEAQ